MKALRVPRNDALLALSLFLVGQVEIWVIGTFSGRAAMTLPAALAATLPLAWRRRAPLLVLSIPFGVLVVEALVAASASVALPRPDSIALLAGWVIAVYSTGAHVELPRSLLGAAIGLSFLPVALAADPTRSLSELDPVSLLFIFIPWLAGVAIRRLRRQAGQLRELAQALEGEREEQALAAVVAERARIARELHDEVAHSVSVIAVQADAAEGALARDPSVARESLGAIKTTARGALVEMRRLLGVLRDAGETPALAPRPGLAQLQSLVEHARQAGVEVELVVEGEPRPLPGGLDLSAYRILQEGLTNVVKHAGHAHARVRVRYGARDLELEVVDDGPGPGAKLNGGGHGLLGMRERVALFGGEMRAGGGPNGGFSLWARLPLEPPSQ
jgi:signal transduction histidine kinase